MIMYSVSIYFKRVYYQIVFNDPYNIIRNNIRSIWDAIVRQSVDRRNVVVDPQDFYVTQNVIIVNLVATNNL
jgi:hypothetical protein